MLARIETKVYAGVAGAIGGITILTPAALWCLGVFVFHASKDASAADAAIKAVPWPLEVAVTGLLGGGATAATAYKAPPSNHAGNLAGGAPMDDSDAGHEAPLPSDDQGLLDDGGEPPADIGQGTADAQHD